MPENLKALRGRIRSIKSTRKITRAMEMVSAAKLRRTENVMKAGLPYANKLQELLQRLSGSVGQIDDPLFQEHETGVVTMVVFTGDRGLCGAYNANIMSVAKKFIDAGSAKHPHEVFAVGRKSVEFFRKREYDIFESRVDLQGVPQADVAAAIANTLRERFISGKSKEVYLAYNEFVSQMQYRPKIELFLPLKPDALIEEDAKQKGPAQEIDYIFEPEQAELFARLLPAYLQSKLYITMAQTMTAEHSARMLAMNSATKNCGELIESLSLRMNKARQAAITTEILEVVSGAEALKG